MCPVEDHDVHESVKIRADKPYGCWGRKGMGDGYYAPDRHYRGNGTFSIHLAYIPHRNSTECRYDLWETDPRCAGCTAEKAK